MPVRSRGLSRSAVSACSIAPSGCPAHSLSTPPRNQPRAKLGVITKARSISSIIVPMSSPKFASTNAAFDQDPRIVLGGLQRLPRQLDGVAAGRFRLVAPTFPDEPHLAHRRQRQGRAAIAIDGHRLLQQVERAEKMLSRYRIVGRERAQIEIVGGEVVGRPRGRTADFGGVQGRLDNAGDTDRHFVLELEHICQRTVEAIRPEMGGGLGLDQLRGDAHPVAALAHRAFEDIADPELASELAANRPPAPYRSSWSCGR